MNIVEIEIINWEKYNPRSDRKNSMWFRLENSIATEPKFFGLKASQKFIAICLFAEASKNCGPKANINIDWLAHQLGVKAEEIIETIRHLEQVGVVAVAGGVAPVSSGCPTNERTNERDERTVTATPPVVADPDLKSLAKEVWATYENAYFERYKTEPVRNAKVNSQVSQLAKRLGTEAVDVVRFYVSHNKTYYASKCHEIGACLNDAEALRTQWAKGKAITNADLKRFEKKVGDHDLDRMIEEGKI